MEYEAIEDLTEEQLDELYSDKILTGENRWFVTCQDGYRSWSWWNDACKSGSASVGACYIEFTDRGTNTRNNATMMVCYNQSHGEYGYLCCKTR